ncbi:MAG: VOC family protein [Coriobacteriales bacterium]|jgi:catechol 2,3-dioxygenase-like lactoylglutathione lyase family enzyme|nr:VOC family protein [Coriobacteriales bacterium]
MELSFQHVGIYCRDIEESISFYEEIFGCKVLFKSDAMEGDKPLKMAWIKGMGIVFELLECEDKAACDAAGQSLNHLALRVDNMDEFITHLNKKGIAIEAGPFDPPLEFDRPLSKEDSDVFITFGDAGAQLRIMFFRGPGGERFEIVQDNIAAL